MRRRVRNQLASYANTLHPHVGAYVACLTDPFTNPPVKLGFGCLTASQTVTLSARYLGSAGSDGSFSAYVIPSVNTTLSSTAGGMYTSNTAAGATLASTQTSWQNLASVGSLLEEARVISCGLRLTPMVPGTAAPGGGFVASIPSTNYAALETTPKATLIQSPLFMWGTAASGATATSRPVDPNSFVFHHDVIGGFAFNEDTPVTVPIVVMNGLPVGMTVLCEAVLQIEGIYSFAGQSQANTNIQSSNVTPSLLPRIFSSLESMWNAVSPLLPSPVAVRTAATLANALLTPSRFTGTSSMPRYIPSTVRGALLP